MQEKRIIFDISAEAVWKIIGILVLLWFLYFIRDVIFILLLAIVVASAILPIVNKAETKGIPRILTTFIIYLFFSVVFGLIFYAVVPQVINESKQLASNFPQRVNEIQQLIPNFSFYSNGEFGDGERLSTKLSDQFSSFVPKIFSNTLNSVGKFFRLMVVFSLSFYMLIKKDGTQKVVELTIPKRYHQYGLSLVAKIQNKIGRWLLGQLVLMFVIFCCYWLLLTILGVPYATVLALIGGTLEIIPYIGPIIATVPAVVIGFSSSPLIGILVLAGYTLIQQLENYVIIPLIMKKAIGLNPVIIILALLVGSKLGGVMGMVLAVPVATAVSIFVSDAMNGKIYSNRKMKSLVKKAE